MTRREGGPRGLIRMKNSSRFNIFGAVSSDDKIVFLRLMDALSCLRELGRIRLIIVLNSAVRVSLALKPDEQAG